MLACRTRRKSFINRQFIRITPVVLRPSVRLPVLTLQLIIVLLWLRFSVRFRVGRRRRSFDRVEGHSKLRLPGYAKTPATRPDGYSRNRHLSFTRAACAGGGKFPWSDDNHEYYGYY